MHEKCQVKRALISVFDKEGLIPFARGLADLEIEIYSTGGTLSKLRQDGLTVFPVENLTEYPEILDGRVKTLHPAVHGGILAKKRNDPELIQNSIHPFDLVVVNLYPFEEAAANNQSNHEWIIENIDIGGPTMIRAAAKNHQRVGVCVDPKDYQDILDKLSNYGKLSTSTRFYLASKAFLYTSRYESAISNYFSQAMMTKENERVQKAKEDTVNQSLFPSHTLYNLESGMSFLDPTLLTGSRQELSYGENPHQKAFFLPTLGSEPEELQGNTLSYNNLNDLDAALQLVYEFERKAAVAVKHTNPCGVGLSDNIVDAFQKAYEADPVSIFGGVLAFNTMVTEDLARKLSDVFLDVIAAPDYEDRALKILKEKRQLKIVRIKPELLKIGYARINTVWSGYLVQQPDLKEVDFSNWKLVTKNSGNISHQDKKDMVMAEKVVKHVKSNAIVVVKDEQTWGIGAGQVSRIGASQLALNAAGERAQGSTLASDAFFPFPDVVELCYSHGVSHIVQPGGSKRDQASIEKAKECGINMFFTGVRRFKH